MILTPSERRRLRKVTLNCGRQVPVHVVEKQAAPWLVKGRRGGWFTRGGDRVLAPVSYGKKGWSNMVYEIDARELWIDRDWAMRLLRPGQWLGQAEDSPYNKGD